MSELDERYGTSRRVTSNSSRWVWLAAAALFVGVVVFWAMTALSPSATVETQTARFEVVSPVSATLQARVSVHPGTPLACAVEAHNTTGTVVGWKVVELAPSEQAHQVIDVTLRTTQAADVVQVKECWVTDH
ncbi:DUF4307 domain-containing protein [Gulosibacter hominis]|uniref:DUF4307 domain-containing protein n=1 Tax=Gulosibacter hominis TaxID=2770504 RepID=UPI0019189C43|nr:DUF4307 domain-containing protein [Gulosibacter hominis]